MNFAFATSPVIQPKLTIGQPNDDYEQEADRVADQVMRMPQTDTPLQRKCDHCKEEGEELQMKAIESIVTPIQRVEEEAEERLQMKGFSNEPVSNEGLTRKLQQSKGSGSSLPDSTRQQMERGIGADFSGVKIHTGNEAIQMNRQLHARAFTNGRDIYFNQGAYQPQSSTGQHLLAHELTHVVQQKDGAISSSQNINLQASATAVPDIQANGGAPSSGYKEATFNVIWSFDSIVLYHRIVAAAQRTGDFRRIRESCFWQPFNAPSHRFSGRHSRRHPLDLNDGDRVEIHASAFYDSRDTPCLSQVRIWHDEDVPAPAPTPAPTPAPEEEEAPALTVNNCGTFPITIGTRGGCGTGDDANTSRFPLSAVPASVSVQAGQLDSLPDFVLRGAPQAALLAGAGADGSDTFDHFYNSTASTRSFSPGSDVATRTQVHAAYVAARRSVESQLIANLTTQAGGNVVDCSAINIASPPSINLSGRADMKLYTLFGGTQGLELELTAMTIDPVARTFHASVRFEICDDFGVDVSDLSRGGASGAFLNNLLLPFWILQHRRTGHTPLILYINLDESFIGTF